MIDDSKGVNKMRWVPCFPSRVASASSTSSFPSTAWAIAMIGLSMAVAVLLIQTEPNWLDSEIKVMGHYEAIVEAEREALYRQRIEDIMGCAMPENRIDYKTVRLRKNDVVSVMGPELCRRNLVAPQVCHKEVIQVMEKHSKNMQKLNFGSQDVNITLDHTLTLKIHFPDTTGDSIILSVSPMTKYFETIQSVCELYSYGEDCHNTTLQAMALDMKRVWCVDSNKTEQIRLPVLLDESKSVMFTLTTENSVGQQCAAFCRQNNLAKDSCFRLYQHAADHFNAVGFHEVNDDHDKSIRFSEPRGQALYPVHRRVYLEFKDTNISLSSGCFHFNLDSSPTDCKRIPLADYTYLLPNELNPGQYIMELREPSSGVTIDAVFFRVTQPRVELSHHQVLKDYPNSFQLEVTSYDFDLYSFGNRVCILIDGLIECMSTPNPVPRDTTIRMKFPVYKRLNGMHSVTPLLLDKYNMCSAIGATVSMIVNHDNATPSLQGQQNDLFIKLQPPKDKAPCPLAVQSRSPWICELYRHDWGLYSQNGEDGILSAIFENIGTTNRYYVEFGVEDGMECNTRFLRERKNWRGLLMDGSFANSSINLQREWITAEGVNILFAKYGVPKELDLLSIDIDFNDYWVWQSIDVSKHSPRIVLVEYNSHLPPNDTRVVSYRPSGQWDGKTSYFGAGIGALYKLGIQKGYSPLYCEKNGVNCFFIRNDVLGYNLSEVFHPEHVYSPTNFYGKGWTYPTQNDTSIVDWVVV